MLDLAKIEQLRFQLRPKHLREGYMKHSLQVFPVARLQSLNLMVLRIQLRTMLLSHLALDREEIWSMLPLLLKEMMGLAESLLMLELKQEQIQHASVARFD